MPAIVQVDSGNTGLVAGNYTGDGYGNFTSTQSITLSSTVNGYLLVWVFINQEGTSIFNTTSPGSALWNGSGMDTFMLLGARNLTPGMAVYGIKNPTSGTHTFTHYSYIGGGFGPYVHAVYYYQTFSNVNQTTPVVTYGATSNTALSAGYTTSGSFDTSVVGAVDLTSFSVPGGFTSDGVNTYSYSYAGTQYWYAGVEHQQYATPSTYTGSFTGGGTSNNGLGYVVLKSNIQNYSEGLSTTVANAASRFINWAKQVAFGNVGANLSAASSAGRKISAGKYYTEIMQLTVSNSASRLATLVSYARSALHNLAKHAVVFTNLTKHVDPVLAPAGLYQGFGVFNYSGGEVLGSTGQYMTNISKNNVTFTNITKN